MFGFKKKEEDRIEPEFDKPTEGQSVEQKNLADILGAQENDTNITAGVDALLDDEGEIGTNRSELAQESVHALSSSDFQQSDENVPSAGEEDNDFAAEGHASRPERLLAPRLRHGAHGGGVPARPRGVDRGGQVRAGVARRLRFL